MSHTKGSKSQRLDIFNRYYEYARIVTDVVVTDEGVYLKDEVPDSYGGAQLEIEMVNCVLMVNSRMEMQVFEFENDYPMDKDKKKGGPIKRDGEDYRVATGDSATVVNQRTKLNDKLSPARIGYGNLARNSLNVLVGGINGEVKT